MDLDILLDSLDALADQTVKLRDLYVPGTGATQGKFVLKAKPSKNGLAIEDVGALRRSLDAEKKAASEARELLASFRGDDGKVIDANAAKEALARIAEMGEDAPKNIKELEAKIEARLQRATELKIAEARGSAFKERDAQKKLADAAIAKLQKTLRADAAMRALAKHNGPAELLPLIEQQLRFSQVTGANGEPDWLVEVVDENGTPRTDPASAGTKPLPVDAVVEEMKKHKVFGALFAGDAREGAGSQTGQRNPNGNPNVITVGEKGFSSIEDYRRARSEAARTGATLDVSHGAPQIVR